MSVVCCQVEVSASGRSLVQRSPTKCGASECHREVPYGEAMNRDRIEQQRGEEKDVD